MSYCLTSKEARITINNQFGVCITEGIRCRVVNVELGAFETRYAIHNSLFLFGRKFFTGLRNNLLVGYIGNSRARGKFKARIGYFFETSDSNGGTCCLMSNHSSPYWSKWRCRMRVCHPSTQHSTPFKVHLGRLISQRLLTPNRATKLCCHVSGLAK